MLYKIPTVMSSMVFSKYFVAHRKQYLFFIIFESLLLFKSLTVATAEVYKFHAF